MVAGRKLVLALCLTAAAAAAQSRFVVPAGMAGKEGDSYSYTPVGRAPCRSQFIYARGAMPAGGLMIRVLRLRRDGNYASPFQGHSFEMEIWMANNGADPAAGYSAVFAENRGPDFTRVFVKKKVDFPYAAKPAKAPASFGLAFVLDTPFRYGGKAFLLEFASHAAAYRSHRWYPDARRTSWSGKPSGGSRSTSGTGCPADFYCYGAKPHIGQALHHYGYSRAAGKSLPALDLIGLSDRHFGPVNLPLALDSLGAPGCSLYTNIILIGLGTTRASGSTGYVRFDWGHLPNQPVMVGRVFFEQQAVADPSFNALGLRLSRLARCTIGSGYTGKVECLNLHGYGSNFTLSTPVAEKAEALGLVLELEK